MLSPPISHQKHRFPQCCGTLIPWEGLSPNSCHYHHEGPISCFPHHSQYPIKLEVLYFVFLSFCFFFFGCAGSFFFLRFIYCLFLVVLGFHCCTWAFSNCGEWGLLSTCSAWASYCGSFSCCTTGALGHVGFSSYDA